MISKTFVTAFVATCLMVGSSASPCKVSSRTTEASTIVGASTTVASVETTATAETTAVTEKASSTGDDTTTTALSSIVLSTTEQLSVTVTASESSATTTTVISSSEGPSVAESTSAEVESTVTSNESVATTTDGTTNGAPTTTEAATTTTAEAPSGPTFIVNTGFEDSSESVSPWSLYTPFSTTSLALDPDVAHDGQNSARLTFSEASQNAVQQQLQGPITAGVTYAVSAWIYTSIGCSLTYLECEYQGDEYVDGVTFVLDPTIVNRWQQLTGTCTFTQGQIDAGDLYVLVGFGCQGNTNAYVDTVSFTTQ
ncbi:hypothetical protein HG530_012427 [Fusarium avenaceum]|nr:hypothetical protein HG530_012427 [Fusarium avenaceum]